MTGTVAEVLTEREQLRQAMRVRRDSLDLEQVGEWGAGIQRRTLEFIAERGSGNIFTYLDVPKEPPTHDLARELLEAARKVAAPRLKRGSFDMCLRWLCDLDTDLVTGMWGIPMPSPQCPQADPALIDVAIVPLTAVDANGYRIGRGGGCYDTFLAEHRHVFALGIGYEIQVVPTCHPQPWDVPMDALVTEAKTRVFPTSAGARP